MLTTGSFRVKTGYLTAFLLLLMSYFLIFLTLQQFLKKMETYETELLQLRKEKLRGVSISIKVITLTSLIIALLLSLYSFVTYSKESRAKQKADEQANSYRNQLANKVKELQEANEEL